MADIALTTIFTPPASCFDNTYTSLGGGFYEKDVNIESSECYPSAYHSLFTEAIPYLPGVCPSGYSYDQTTSYSNDATAALCCPSGMTAYDSGLGCSSVVNGDTDLYVDGSTITVDQARLAVHGVYIAWQSSEVQAATSSSPAPSTSTPAAYNDPIASSPALRSTSSMPRATSSSSTENSHSTSSGGLSTFSSRTISTLISPDVPPSTVTVVTSRSATSTSTPPPPLSTAAKAGIGVGASVAGIAAIVAVGALFLWRRRKQQKEPNTYPQAAMYKEDPEPAVGSRAHHISELSSDGVRSELSGVLPWIEAQQKRGNAGRAELEGQ